MSNFDIVIPWRDAGCNFRGRHFKFLYEYYSKLSNVIVSDSNEKNFNRAQARNNGVKSSVKDVVVVIDADNFINLDQILFGVELSMNNETLIRPFNSIHYLNENATDRFYSCPEEFYPQSQDYTYMLPSSIGYMNSGGAFIIKRHLWDKLGGMDENFEGWGLEDSAFNASCQYFLGDQLFVSGPNYNLYHPAERNLLKKNIDRYIIWYSSGRIFKEKK